MAVWPPSTHMVAVSIFRTIYYACERICDTICMGVYIHTFLLIFSEICDVGLEITDQDLQNAYLK